MSKRAATIILSRAEIDLIRECLRTVADDAQNLVEHIGIDGIRGDADALQTKIAKIRRTDRLLKDAIE